MKIAIIGAGAAGYFAAINLKELAPEVEITIFEANSVSLAKVKVSGGGRCNLSNTFANIKSLGKAYPRGEKLIKRAFKKFSPEDTYKWFEDHNIELTIQDDQCIFPKSQSSQEIIDTFTTLSTNYGITVKHSHKVQMVIPQEKGYQLDFNDKKLKSQTFDAVIVTTGGAPKKEGINFLSKLNLEIIDPLPSLFSLNIPNNKITELMGAVVQNAQISLSGTKITALDTLLITHWGFSGPAALKLSSYAARILADKDYNATIRINWCAKTKADQLSEQIEDALRSNPAKKLSSIKVSALPTRLWGHLLEKSGISPDKKCAELGSKGLNKLINTLTNDEYQIQGQTRFKEEFVTAGGVALSNIDQETCESKQHPMLYFAGEVLDIDAITGGFNLQAAWSTAYTIAQSIKKQKNIKS